MAQFFGIAFVIGMFMMVESTRIYAIWAAVFLGLLVIGIAGYVVSNGPKFAENLDRAKARVRGIVSQHLDELARSYLTLNVRDKYGVEDSSKWWAEFDYFYERVIVPQLTDAEKSIITTLVSSSRATYFFELCQPIHARANEIFQKTDISSVSSGIEFEMYTKNALEKQGWKTQITKASGDQGADVVATKAGRRLVVQCKFYSRPVGNKAVQEAHAAKMHYRADYAVVVSNAKYTSSATDLSRSTGVRLLSYNDIPRLDRLLNSL